MLMKIIKQVKKTIEKHHRRNCKEIEIAKTEGRSSNYKVKSNPDALGKCPSNITDEKGEAMTTEHIFIAHKNS